MCEANVYLERNGSLEEIMKNVISITPQSSGQLLLIDLFGEQRTVDALIKEVRLLEHKVIIKAG